MKQSTAIGTEGNPYLKAVANDQQQPRTDGETALDEEAQQEEALHRAEEEKKRKRRRHRWIALGFILMLLSASIAFAVVLYRTNSVTVEYGQAAKQTRALTAQSNGSVPRDNRHEQAIQEVQRLGEAGRADSAKQQFPKAGTNSQKLANDSGSITTNESQRPFTIPPSATSTNNASSAEKDSSATASTPNEQPHVRSQRNSETSLYVGEGNKEPIQPTTRNAQRSSIESGRASENTETTVVTPPFGSILPVRAIGGLYTLRSGAFARFELTRDISGNGWSMKRGTILVGTTKGGEYSRAYVSIIGFIDPQSGKLVKLGGDVLGGDGTAGLKGKSRQVDSRWTRVLSQVGNAAVTLTGALLGGRGNGTVVISDTARAPVINPIADELNGVLGSQTERNRRGGFVEIVAGTPGYVIVTDLPAEIKATDANELNQQTLATLADLDAIRPATGISEREFADLLADGSPDEIRAKLPRMSPEMRKIALVVLER
ncbi:MAG TPA: hypothetical protein VJT15_24875 [Pyrinomonadaceae bacterium]|nr:hypothetical protein [Pyrinomonadaceae bacterium]